LNSTERNDTVTAIADNERTVSASKSNYAAVRFNALTHGILSRHTVLPHEDEQEFADLVTALVAEHQPSGPTELLLVQELASIIWRKRRVLLAEGAVINRGMLGVTSDANSTIAKAAAPFEYQMPDEPTDVQDVVTASPDRIAQVQEEARSELESTQSILKILRKADARAYETALGLLGAGARELWEDFVEDDEYEATLEGLTAYVYSLLPISIGLEKEARHYLAIRAQMLGEGLKADRLEKIARYETHLDRKFERTLAMLIKLRQLRGNRPGENTG